MMNKDLSFFVTRFFTHYLANQRNVSGNTICAYRDTFLLFFAFLKEEKGINTNKLQIEKITREYVISFLDWLEETRHNSITTRNQRLAAIHAFFKYLLAENVEYMLQSRQILSIPFKKHAKAIVPYLQENELKHLLEMPDIETIWGRRDLVLLCVLYDTGGRVQEIIDLKVNDVRFEAPATICLTGKGRKSRIVPLMNRTASLLKEYINEQEQNIAEASGIIFFNKQKQKLTRKGVAYILEKYASKAAEVNDMPTFKITPHVLRHTKAMHLLRAGVNLFYIRDILGHVDISTTEIYAKIDVEQKRDILESVSNATTSVNMKQWKNEPDLMAWLKGLGK